MEQIYFNGKIITMNAANEHEEKLNEPEAVLVKDGMISQIGKRLWRNSFLYRKCIVS